ncbi:MAG: nitrate ABC transporter substrate-binding protein, partial [Gammaproteobacteria bacterium]|nr:nitrate ABC transporter substrate-binding protein [Gammaproteobacteria bacterium]
QIAEARDDSWYDEVAKSVYRPDIYATAAKELIAEGKMTADEFPDFASETGYRAPQTEFIDGVTFDGTKPNAYLDAFEIGLKGSEKP